MTLSLFCCRQDGGFAASLASSFPSLAVPGFQRVNMPAASAYIGRFAPTPSGPLHMGSLLTAVASWLRARAAGGQWRLRIDDLDAPRCQPGAEATILQQLEAHGLDWDGDVDRQSAHHAVYAAALQRLIDAGQVYRCICTRQQRVATARPGRHGPVYDGRCRDAGHRIEGDGALRLRLPATARLDFEDAALGPQSCDPERDVGDFILLRRDGVLAYHLACAIDESRLGISEVVRGGDLLASTFPQLAIMDALGLRRPAYRHGPLLLDAHGRKLSKQNHAPAIDPARASANLLHCLQALGLQAPENAVHLPPRRLLAETLARL